jgi:predicted AlkP superfamily pyrophosphatase or phosphodiesterase
MAYAGTYWELLHDPETYLFGKLDDQPFETDFPGYGRTFPHAYGEADDRYLTTRLTLGPAGDRLVLDFARTLIAEEGLGDDAVTDYLAVSFSSNDYVAHLFGPSSLEFEDNFLRLDRTLAELLKFVDEQVGLRHTLVVLSADHGTPEVPGYLRSHGFSGARYFDVPSVDQSPLIRSLKERYGIGEALIESYNHPYIYLNDAAIRDAGLSKDEVEEAVSDVLNGVDGIAAAVSSSALRRGQVPDGELMDAIRRNFHPKRSGDIYIVFEPHVFINDFDGLTVAATHGSPWRYDAHVPIMFAGYQLHAQQVSRPVAPYDIAPTLAALLGVAKPSASIGSPLPEVLGR